IQNKQRDAMYQMKVNKGTVVYNKNSLNNNDPHTTPKEEGGYEHYQEKVEGHKIQKRSESFKDYYSQAKLYLNSLTQAEFDHTVGGFSFEIGMCNSVTIKQNAVNQLNKVDRTLAERVAKNVGVEVPETNEEVQSDATDSQLTMEKFDIPLAGHSVAVAVNGDINTDTLKSYAQTFTENKLNYDFVGQHPKDISKDFGITETFVTAHPTIIDSLIVLSDGSDVSRAVEEFAELKYKHSKPLVVNQTAGTGLTEAKLNLAAPGVYASDAPQTIVQAFDRKRYWDR